MERWSGNINNLGWKHFPMRGLTSTWKLKCTKQEWEIKGPFMVNVKEFKIKKKTCLFYMMALRYANGNIHIGHALNKFSKDIIVRYQINDGLIVLLMPGWDTQGCPWNKLLTNKVLSVKEEMSCQSFVENYVKSMLGNKLIRQRGMILSAFGVLLREWDNPYVNVEILDYERKKHKFVFW